MQRISKIIKKDNFVPEYGYLVFSEKGLVVFNGKLGILYSPKLVGERLMAVVARHGRFAVPDASKFLRTLAVLEDVATVDLDKSNSCLSIKFMKGKGSLEVPVVLNLHEKIPHLEIKWKDYETDKADSIQVSSAWREIADLITTEGEALWGNVIGIYIKNNKLLSFDYGVYLSGQDCGSNQKNCFCPLEAIELGLNNIEYMKSDESGVFLVGNLVQYMCSSVSSSPVIDDMAKLKDDFTQGTQFKVTIDTTSGLWRRAKLFASEILKFEVKGGDIVISHENWKESIGKTGAPDAEFNTRISLLQRWAAGSLDHKISVSSNGSWYLHGTTRSGLDFYAVLTDLNNPMKDSKPSNVVVLQQKSEEVDIVPSGALL